MSPSAWLPVVAAVLIGAAALAPGRPPRPIDAEAPMSPDAAPARRRPARGVDLDAQFADTVELVVLAVRAGHLPHSALRAVLPHAPPGVQPGLHEVLVRFDQGERFADALGALTQHLGPRAHVLVDGLAAADRDGLPLAPVLDRLAAEARADRRRRIDTLARQLPVRMSLPLVLCTLPSFVLLTVVPLLLAALTSLRR